MSAISFLQFLQLDTEFEVSLMGLAWFHGSLQLSGWMKPPESTELRAALVFISVGSQQPMRLAGRCTVATAEIVHSVPACLCQRWAKEEAAAEHVAMPCASAEPCRALQTVLLSVQGWGDVYFFCGRQLQYCTCNFRYAHERAGRDVACGHAAKI